MGVVGAEPLKLLPATVFLRKKRSATSAEHFSIIFSQKKIIFPQKKSRIFPLILFSNTPEWPSSEGQKAFFITILVFWNNLSVPVLNLQTLRSNHRV
jgi:hypothetical protein